MLVDQAVLFNHPAAYRAGSEEAAARCPGTTLCHAGGGGRDPGQDSFPRSRCPPAKQGEHRADAWASPSQPPPCTSQPPRIEHGRLLQNGLLHRLPCFLISPPAPLWFGKLRPRSVKPPTLPDGSCHKQQMRTRGEET